MDESLVFRRERRSTFRCEWKSTYEPQKMTQADFCDATLLTQIKLHWYDAMTNVTESMAMALAAQENDIPDGWPQTGNKAGSLVTHLSEMPLKADASLTSLITGAINRTGCSLWTRTLRA
jgi:hypothetical protein